MPCQAELVCRAALAKQGKHHTDENGGKYGENGDGAVLTVEESPRALKYGIRDFLHFRGAAILAQYESGKVHREKHRQYPDDKGYDNLVAHVSLRPP